MLLQNSLFSIRLLNVFTALIFFIGAQNAAANNNELYIPNALTDWKDWVLQDNHQLLCPDSVNGQEKNCVWPGRLQLFQQQYLKQIKFKQKFSVYGKSRVFLPGGEKVWPEKVTINDQPAIVLEHNKRPYVWLKAGKYELSGLLSWQAKLAYIPLSRETVLVDYYKDKAGKSSEKKQAVLQKKISIDSENRLWLEQSAGQVANSEHKPNDSLDIKVFRKISDGIPLLMESFYRIKVSGSARQLSINNVVAPGFVPYSYSSRLPARLSKDNSLVLQLKPGTWTFSLTARSTGQLNQLAFFSKPDIAQTASQNEIWVFEENLSLQQVEASSSQTIDSTQTLMPAEWKKLPAFLMKPGSVLKMEIKKRGNATPAANNLALERKIWLDFSGQGMTVQDHIKGDMNRQWRLNLMPQVTAGKVSLNNKPQLITLSTDNQPGVELQNGKIDLKAESRIESNIDDISATGWQEDFKQLKASLFLPPGWSVFHVSGVDSQSSGWINQWTLLDLFQVLLLSIIFYRLWGTIWGITALCCFVLLQHRTGAPIWVWFHILLAIGLLRIVTKGRLNTLLSWYKNASILVLIIYLLPFLVDEIRSSIYPQLDISSYQLDMAKSKRSSYRKNRDYNMPPEPMAEMAIAPQAYRKMQSTVADGVSLDSMDEGFMLSNKKPLRPKILNQYDAKAKIQTGPGLPGWSFNRVNLNWSGPVSQQQRIQFYFISPGLNLLLTLLMLLFSVVLVYRVVNVASLGSFITNKQKDNNAKELQSKLMIGFVLLICSGLFSHNLMANQLDKTQNTGFPSAFLLDELNNRLTKPDLCHPQCALIENMHISLSGSELSLRLTVNSGAFISFPLPLDENQLTINEIIVDGQLIEQFRNKNTAAPRQLSVPLGKGKHQLGISSQVNGDSLVLPLDIPSYNITHRMKGWSISGLKGSQALANQLVLQKKQLPKSTDKTRLKADKVMAKEDNIPVFVMIKRRFYFDLEWTIDTTISRLSDRMRSHSSAVIFDYPLLAGESVISSNKQVANNNIRVNLAPGQNHFNWSSRLKKSDNLQLMAKDNPDWVEQWELFINPVWHIEHKGLAPIQHTNSSQGHQPVWRPWPGETLDLSIVRPTAIAGKTRTITKSKRKSKFGNKLSEHQLDINFNSSQGGKHIIMLPEKVQMTSLKVSGKKLAIDEKQNKLEFSLAAGEQKVQIKWRENTPMTNKIISSSVNLGVASVNSHLKIELPRDRWTIYTFGPDVGPVVLFWGMLLIILIVAYAVSKIPGMPLTSVQALLLTIGLAPVSLWSLLVVLIWFVAIIRRKHATELSPFLFNCMQLALVLFTLGTLSLFIYTIQSGLLGYPDMHILGNGSSAYHLNWYQDRSAELLPQATIISLPIYWYRIFMLLWALWLAFIVIRWAVWAWKNFSYGGYWKKINWKLKALKFKKPAKEKDDTDANKE